MPTTVSTGYLGITIKEATFGGFFATNLFALWSFGVFKAKRLFQDVTVKRLSLFLFFSIFVVIIADTQMAGILLRYFPDFSWMALIVSALVLMQLDSICSQSKWIKTLRFIVLVTAFVSLSYQFLLAFTDIDYPLRDFDPVVFYRFESIFSFLA